METKFGRKSWVLVLALSLATPAMAADWYVSAQGGSDFNDGQSPSTAWRTITHALASIPTGATEQHSLYVAAGVYDAAGGEQFPLSPGAGVRVFGDAGGGETIVQGPASALFFFASSETQPLDAWCGLERLTLRNATNGIVVHSSGAPNRMSCSDLVVEGMGDYAISTQHSPPSLGFAVVEPTFASVRISSCRVGVDSSAGAGQLEGARSFVSLVDCVIRNCAEQGARTGGWGNGRSYLKLERCRIEGNGGDGVYCGSVTFNFEPNVEAIACVIAGNRGHGVYAFTGMFFGSTRLIDCTIAANQNAGVMIGDNQSASLENCLLALNAADVQPGSNVDAKGCNAADGSLRAFPTCMAYPPQFVDAPAGNFALQWGSPCIDRGARTARERFDINGHPRTVDGDLDTQGAPDLGAIEFRTLRSSGELRLGESIELEVWGAPLASSRLLLARRPLLPARPTPFGAFELERARTIGWVRVPLVPQAPGVLERALASDPALVGTTYSIQALTTSSAAPFGRALSNAIELTVAH